MLKLLFVLLLSSTNAIAALTIPTQLTPVDQRTALSVLGFGSTYKMLSNTAPLGGGWGYELGFSQETISGSSLAGIGSYTRRPSDSSVYSLSVGKGLFYNVDTFLSFTPLQQEEDIMGFGIMVRWAFFNSDRGLPVTLSLVTHGSGTNFSNLVSVQTIGLDLVAGVRSDDVSFYFGAGQVRTNALFIGGAGGVTQSGNTEQVDLTESHTLFGLNVDFKPYFVAVQIDRYESSSYSIKLGSRF